MRAHNVHLRNRAYCQDVCVSVRRMCGLPRRTRSPRCHNLRHDQSQRQKSKSRPTSGAPLQPAQDQIQPSRSASKSERLIIRLASGLGYARRDDGRAGKKLAEQREGDAELVRTCRRPKPSWQGREKGRALSWKDLEEDTSRLRAIRSKPCRGRRGQSRGRHDQPRGRRSSHSSFPSLFRLL